MSTMEEDISNYSPQGIQISSAILEMLNNKGGEEKSCNKTAN